MSNIVLPEVCWKDGTPSQYGTAIAISDQANIDRAAMSVVVPFAAGLRRDGVGDYLEVSGIDTSRHIRNPIALFDHGKTVTLPIGLCEDRLTKAYTVRIDPTQEVADARVFFYQGKGLQGVDGEQEKQHALFCEQLFDLVAEGYIRAGSIGYQVIDAVRLPADWSKGTPEGLHLKKVLLLEVSIVVIPAHGDTVRKLLAMPRICGKAMSPLLVKSLQPYVVEESKSFVGGTTEGYRNRDDSQEKVGKYNIVTDRTGGMLIWPVGVPLGSGSKIVEGPFADDEQARGRLHQLGTKELSNLTPTDVPPVKWKPGLGAIKDIRMKYRGKKGLVLQIENEADTYRYVLRNEYDSQVAAGYWEISREEAERRGQAVANSMGRQVDKVIDVRAKYRGKKGFHTKGMEVVQFGSLGIGARFMMGVSKDWWEKVDREKAKNTRTGDVVRVLGREDAYVEENGIKSLRQHYRRKWIAPSQVVPAYTGESRAAQEELPPQTMTDPAPQKAPQAVKQGWGFMSAEQRNKVQKQYGKAFRPDKPAQTGEAIRIFDGPFKGRRGKIVSLGEEATIVELDMNGGHATVPNEYFRVIREKGLVPNVKSIRARYRNVKNYRRRLKKSSPGASVLRVAESDLKGVKDMAESRGLKFQRLGPGEHGTEKVKLVGDDGSIDQVAKQYGR